MIHFVKEKETFVNQELDGIKSVDYFHPGCDLSQKTDSYVIFVVENYLPFFDLVFCFISLSPPPPPPPPLACFLAMDSSVFILWSLLHLPAACHFFFIEQFGVILLHFPIPMCLFIQDFVLEFVSESYCQLSLLNAQPIVIFQHTHTHTLPL